MTNPWDNSPGAKRSKPANPSQKPASSSKEPSHPSKARHDSIASGTTQPSIENEFSVLGLDKGVIENLTQLGFTRMTDIQRETLPLTLDGKDVTAQAKTGSGKTAAFGIPMLNKINIRFFGAQGLVLCPTRELATQVAAELRKLARYLANTKIVVLTGGTPIGPQIGSLAHGAHLIVGTPGRVKDHLRKGTLEIDQINTLVLDEADRMLDMGFSEDIEEILSYSNSERQTLLFSATYPKNIEALSSTCQQNPTLIKVEAAHTQSSIEQRIYLCDSREKTHGLLKLIGQLSEQYAVVFCSTRIQTEEIASLLAEQGFEARALHGDMEQRERDQTLTVFKQGSIHFLVATDVAARGLDVDDLPAVINFELPRDSDVYVHRIGRTGRAGKEGVAYSLVSTEEMIKLKRVEERVGYDLEPESLDSLLNTNWAVEPREWVTLSIGAGRKHKIRPGDLLGAITGKSNIPGPAVGNISVQEYVSYVAVHKEHARNAESHLNRNKLKGRSVKARSV